MDAVCYLPVTELVIDMTTFLFDYRTTFTRRAWISRHWSSIFSLIKRNWRIHEHVIESNVHDLSVIYRYSSLHLINWEVWVETWNFLFLIWISHSDSISCANHTNSLALNKCLAPFRSKRQRCCFSNIPEGRLASKADLRRVFQPICHFKILSAFLIPFSGIIFPWMFRKTCKEIVWFNTKRDFLNVFCLIELKSAEMFDLCLSEELAPIVNC